MMKTCTVCGLKYQTMAEKGYKYCHCCAVNLVRDTLLHIQPILFELNKMHLNLLSGICVNTNLHIMNELDRRDRYFANMIDQRKPL